MDGSKESWTSLRDELCVKLQRESPSGRWPALFAGEARDAVTFEERTVCIMQIDCAAAAGWSPADRDTYRRELQRMVILAGGTVDPCVRSGVLACFYNVSTAVQLALSLLALDEELRAGVALCQGPCTFASFQVDGAPLWTILGTQLARVAQLLEAAPAGAVALGPEVHGYVQRSMPGATAGKLQMFEFFADQLMQVNVANPPAPESEIPSTFGGLGLTSDGDSDFPEQSFYSPQLLAGRSSEQMPLA